MLDDEHSLEYSHSKDKGSFVHMALCIELFNVDDLMSLTMSSPRSAEHWGLKGTFCLMYIFSRPQDKKRICLKEASGRGNSYWLSSK